VCSELQATQLVAVWPFRDSIAPRNRNLFIAFGLAMNFGPLGRLMLRWA
jgi:hypothetical protein